jgi:hypothetical protein
MGNSISKYAATDLLCVPLRLYQVLAESKSSKLHFTDIKLANFT